MPEVLDLTDGLLRLTDGTRTFDVSPCAGDANLADGADTVTYLHRGKIISDGSGTRLADETNAEATVVGHFLWQKDNSAYDGWFCWDPSWWFSWYGDSANTGCDKPALFRLKTFPTEHQLREHEAIIAEYRSHGFENTRVARIQNLVPNWGQQSIRLLGEAVGVEDLD